MKTFIYIIKKRNNNVSGNPRDLIKIYRVKNNVPEMLLNGILVGYRSNEQAAHEELIDAGHIPKRLRCAYREEIREAGYRLMEITNN